MHPDVEALVKLQEEDLTIDRLEDELASLEPRVKQLSKAREGAEVELTKAREAVAIEERAHTMLRGRIEQHRELRDRNTGQMDMVARPREAAAAMAQLEQAQRLIAEDEAELERANNRLRELRETVSEREYAVEEAKDAEANARTSIDTEREALDERLREARARRDGAAAPVPSSMLSRYDRIRSRRRERAVYGVRDNSCEHCDTMIPTQRRNAMAAKGTIDVCEGCGVLLYAE